MNSIVVIGTTNSDSENVYIDHIILEDEQGKEYQLYWNLQCNSNGKDKLGHTVISMTGCYILKGTNDKYSEIEMDEIMNSIVKFYPSYSEYAPMEYEFILEEIDYCTNAYTPIITKHIQAMNEELRSIGGKELDVDKARDLLLKEVDCPFLAIKIFNEINNI